MTTKKLDRRGRGSSNTLRQAMGARFRSERKRLGLTQEQLGDELDVISLSIANYEHGESSPPADLLHRFHLIGGDIRYIVTGARSLDSPESRECFSLAYRLVRSQRQLGQYKISDDELLSLVWYLFDALGELAPGVQLDERAITKLLLPVMQKA